MPEGPPFFIVGSARSGTTLLRLILNAHPDVAVPPESRFITELYEGRDRVEVDSLLDRLAAHQRFAAWEVPIEEIRRELSGSRARYSEIMTAAYSAYARLQEKSRWGDKTPRYVENIPLLARLFPEAKFIHLIRDGRNVALSYAEVPFGPKSIVKVAALWAQRVAAGMLDGRPLHGDRYHEMLYEDLVEDAAGEIKSTCEFLELEFDPEMLDYTERAGDAMLPRAERFNPRVTDGTIAARRSWQDVMPDRQVELFEAVAGPVLSELGYERRYPEPRLGARIGATLGRWGLPVGLLKKHR
jgi:hypothetical protein